MFLDEKSTQKLLYLIKSSPGRWFLSACSVKHEASAPSGEKIKVCKDLQGSKCTRIYNDGVVERKEKKEKRDTSLGVGGAEMFLGNLQ